MRWKEARVIKFVGFVGCTFGFNFLGNIKMIYIKSKRNM